MKWLTRKTATIIYVGYHKNRYDMHDNPLVWSWMWNDEVPHILHNWHRFTRYLQRGQWK